MVMQIVQPQIGSTLSDTNGLALVNPTLATSVAPLQYSPSLNWQGSGWNAGATTPASEFVDFLAYVAPATAGGDPTGSLVFQSSVMGIRFRSTGDSTTPAGGGMYQASDNNLYLQAAAVGNTIGLRDGSGNNTFLFSNRGGGSLYLPTGSQFLPATQDVTNALQIATVAGTAFVDFDSVNQRVGIGVAVTLPKAVLHASASTIVGAASVAQTSDLGNSQVNIWVTESVQGTPTQLNFLVKSSGGIVKSVAVTLS